jgi:ribosomal protein L7/L12
VSPSNPFRSYYDGPYRYDDYLLDVTEALAANNDLQRRSNSYQAQEVKARRHQDEETARYQAASLEESRGIRDELQGMREEVRLGFSIVVDRMDHQIELFSLAVVHLDDIRQTLKAPRQTEWNELFQRAEQHFEDDLFDEALAEFSKAEQIDKVNYLLQFRIGTLLFQYGNRNRSVVDLEQAEAHLLLATRYAEVEANRDPLARRFAGDACFRAGQAAYCLGKQLQDGGDLDGMQACMRRALVHFTNSAQLWPECRLRIDWQARCHALLGQELEALQAFEHLSDCNREYYADAMKDDDLRSISLEVDRVFKTAIENPGPQARSVLAGLDSTTELLARAENIGIPDVAAVTSFAQRLATGRNLLASLNVNIDQLGAQQTRANQEFRKTIEHTLNSRVSSFDSQLKVLESRRRELEAEIQSIRQQIRARRWGFGFLFVFIAWGVFTVFAVALEGDPSEDVATNVLYLVGMASAGMIGFFLGWNVSGLGKGRGSKEQIGQKAKDLQGVECELQTLRQSYETSKRQFQEFSAWQRAAHPVEVLTAIQSSGPYTAILTSVGDNKINVIKAIRETRGLDLREAKSIADDAPCPISAGISKQEAERIQSVLSQVGATVQITS